MTVDAAGDPRQVPPPRTPQRVVIVGASLGGVRTAQALRSKGFDGSVTLVGGERHAPYDRPPLSKAALDPARPPAPVPLLTPARWEGLEVDLRLGVRAVGLDLSARLVLLDDGEPLGFDVLVIATGARARRFGVEPGSAGSDTADVTGVLTLRTFDDAVLLRTQLEGCSRVAVLGGGFIGAEVAVAARARDLPTTIVEVLPAPMARALGTEVGALLGALHADHGVTLRCGAAVRGIRSEAGRVTGLDLGESEPVDADLVVVGLGATPDTAWLAGSGLDTGDGVLCDASLRALGAEDVYAVGDVARWPHPLLGRHVRVEHWTNAQEHAGVVAAGILGEPATADAVPYVWSTQYGRRLEIVGRPAPTDGVTLIADPQDGRHVAVYDRDGLATGLFAIDKPKASLQGRLAISNRESAAALLVRL